MIGQKTDSFLQLFAGILLLSIAFFPDFRFAANLPAIQFLDLMLPFVCVLLFLKRKSIVWLNYYTFLGIFGAYILVTMAINGRLGVTKDYFEVYKFFKFFAVILLFTLVDARQFLKQWVKPVFIGLVIVNMIHFFDLFGFNHIVQHHYEGGLNIKYFGKDTLGSPVGKRMVGLIGNPNSNAILFSFFTIYFLPFAMNRKNATWFATALTMVFLCQSRTSLVAIAVILVAILVFRLSNWKVREWLIVLGLVGWAYFIAWMLSSSFFKYPIYGNSMFNGAALESHSAMGRWEAWKYLGKMIADKPVFGHGPFKDFFYSNRIYSENEYVLYTWRYGVIGLLLYLSIYFIPLKKLCFPSKGTYSRYILLICVLMLVTALTNNPFTERNILILFAISLGVQFNFSNQKDPATL